MQFSHPGGFITEPITVTLTAPTPGSVIRYTLDGSMPGTTNGQAYSQPIVIDATRRLRAVAVGTDGQVSRVGGEGYIRLAPELESYTTTLPILVIENFGAGIIPQKGWAA